MFLKSKPVTKKILVTMLVAHLEVKQYLSHCQFYISKNNPVWFVNFIKS